MAESLWSQDSFTSGELSPLMYSRITVDNYYNGLKLAKNAITLPQGAVEKRFGTKFWAEIPNDVPHEQVRFAVFDYLNECTYLLVFVPNGIYVFLEKRLIASVENTTFSQDDILALDYTVLQDRFIVTLPGYRPKELKRSDGGNYIKAEFKVGPAPGYVATIPAGTLDSAIIYQSKITIGVAYGFKRAAVGNGGTALNLYNGGQTLYDNITYEVFITANNADETFPTAVPPIVAGTHYYVRGLTHDHKFICSLYPSPADAVAGINAFVFSSAANFTLNIIHQNESGVPPSPLDTTTTYFLRVFNDTELRFYSNLPNAIADTPINLTNAGTEPYYINAYDGINSITNTDKDANTITITTALDVDSIYPIKIGNIQFFSSVPSINDITTYFLRMDTTTTGKIYLTIDDAVNAVNELSLGTYTAGSFISVQNSWTLSDMEFKNRPAYDFNNINYDTIVFTSTFTANTTTQTLTTGGVSFFSKAYEGGIFIGSGGVARLTKFQSTTSFEIELLKVFDGTVGSNVITKGEAASILEPAWSNNRGWPTKCSSFQNRLIFANSRSLPNGVWLSDINGYQDFDDSLPDDDNAISWYPSSNEINFIRFIVPYRSLTIHTNTGVYSTGLGADSAITPRNFSLVLQESTPATAIQPRAIDNQIIVVSGNDVQSMIWDAYNNSYQTNIVSVMSEHLIRDPVDEAPYRDTNRAGSRYAFMVNDDGTLAMYQTLLAENISGFTKAELEQSYGNAYFKQVDSSTTNKCWFVIERDIAEQDVIESPITSVAGTTVTATGSNLSTTIPFRGFYNANVIPTTVPQIVANDIYWVLGLTPNTYKVYPTRADALADTNAISFTNAGTDAVLIYYPTYEITAVATTTMTAPGSNFSTTEATPMKFLASTLPGLTVTVPAQDPINQTDYFWAVGIDANNFKVFRNQSDANADTNAVSFADIGSVASVENWSATQKWYIEQLDFTKYMDCADEYSGAATTSVPVDARYNAQNLLMNADGVKYEGIVANETFTTTANVTDAQYGFGIHFKVQPLALANAIGSSIKQTNLVFPKHVRSVTMMYNDTIGGSVNGKTMSSLDGNGTQLFEIATMKSWDDFRNTSITIEHTEPYPIRLLGLYYKIDI